MTEFISIVGCEPDTGCDHCGRHLKVGVRTATHGILGADCFDKMIKADKRRFSGNGKPGAALIRTYAKLRERDSDEQLRRMGYTPDRSFTFEFLGGTP